MTKLPIETKDGVEWTGVRPYRIDVPVTGEAFAPGLRELANVGPNEPTVYVAIAKNATEAQEQVERRRSPKDSTGWTVVEDWELWTAPSVIVLCPICENRFKYGGSDESDPHTGYARCTTCDYTVWVDSKLGKQAEGEEPTLGVVGESCDKCGKRLVLNYSIGSQCCINPDCVDYEEEYVGELDEEDFEVSGLDWAEVGFVNCDDCGIGFITDGDAAVDLYDSDGTFSEVRTLCPACHERLGYDDAGHALEPREAKTTEQVLAEGGTVGAVVLKDAFTLEDGTRWPAGAAPPEGIAPLTYHAVLTLDSSPGGYTLGISFAEKLPFKVEVFGLATVERQRIDEADENENVTIPVHPDDKADDPYSEWYWDGDGTGDFEDDSEFAREAWKQRRAAEAYIAEWDAKRAAQDAARKEEDR